MVTGEGDGRSSAFDFLPKEIKVLNIDIENELGLVPPFPTHTFTKLLLLLC